MDAGAPEAQPMGKLTTALNTLPTQERGRGDGALGFAQNAIIVAVGAVILDDAERILLVKHVPERKSFWQGKWICPGGRLQVGEGIEAGIRREVWEETHLHIRLNRPLVPFERIIHGEGGVRLHVVYIDYLAEKIGGELQPGDDVGEAAWIPRPQLPLLGEALHADTRRLLVIAQLMEEV
jgi:ADP-ribose pyrophosphatase YjhB (NUDIX family)